MFCILYITTFLTALKFDGRITQQEFNLTISLLLSDALAQKSGKDLLKLLLFSIYLLPMCPSYLYVYVKNGLSKFPSTPIVI